MSRVVLAIVAALALVAPSVAAAADELSVTTRLGDRRFVVAGPRAYETGTQAGRYPAMGFHTRGEMGGVWSPPLKLLDGIWFGIDGAWIGPATRFTSGWGHARTTLPGRPGLAVERTDVVPGDARGLLVGLRLRSTGPAQSLVLTMQAHSELMSAYPWGETKPFTQARFNLPDAATFAGNALVFTEQGTPPVPGATAHDWAAAVGAAIAPDGQQTGPGFRGPQARPVICPPSGPGTPTQPRRCDDTAYGKGAGGELLYRITVPAGGERTIWFGVAGSESGAADAQAALRAILADPDGALRAKVAEREALAAHTKLSLPGDPRLAEAIEWSKQNLADAVQETRDLRVRATNAGTRYPAPAATVARARFLAAGFPDYPWLFATDGEYTAFASVALGQFEPAVDHMRALRDVSRALNGSSGKVVHEVVGDGTVYFGALATPATPTRRPSCRAPSRSCGDGRATTRSCARCTRSPARTCATSSVAWTRTATAGPRAWATSSARAWARRSSTTPSTRSAGCGTWRTWRRRAATAPPSAGRSAAPAGCSAASRPRGGCPRSRRTPTRSTTPATTGSSSATGSA
jgi:hypothetical protein